MRHDDDERQDQLGRRIAEPERRRVGHAHFGHRDQPPDGTEANAKRQQVDQGALLADRDRGPQRDDPASEIDAGEEAVHVVEPQRGVGLPERHL